MGNLPILFMIWFFFISAFVPFLFSFILLMIKHVPFGVYSEMLILNIKYHEFVCNVSSDKLYMFFYIGVLTYFVCYLISDKE